MKQNLSGSKLVAACLQEVSNGFPLPSQGEGFSSHDLCRLLWGCAFLCLREAKEKRPFSFIGRLSIYTIRTFLSHLQRASNLPAWVIDGLTAQLLTSLNKDLFKKITLWDSANQPINQEKKKMYLFFPSLSVTQDLGRDSLQCKKDYTYSSFFNTFFHKA